MNAKLLVVQGRPQGKTMLFPPGDYIFGRGSECHIRPNSDWVSRQHCLFRVLPDGKISVSDLGSRNGTLVNGIRVVSEIVLKDGDHLQVGPLVFEVYLEEGSGLRRVPHTSSPKETVVQNENTSQQLAGVVDLGITPGSPTESTQSRIEIPANKAS